MPQGRPWERYGGQAQPALVPITGPREPAPQTPAQAQGDVIDLQRDRAALEQAPVDLERARIERDRAAVQLQQDQREAQAAEQRAGQTQQQRDAALAQIQQTIQNARQAQRLSREGWFTTGFGAGAAHRVAPGGSSQADLQALLSQIGSNTAFDRLQRMRDMSPTGGALGQVSNIELELLKNSIASLDVTQSDDQFQRNMQNIIDSYSRVYQGLGGNPAEIGAQGGQEPSRRAPPGTELRFNDEIPEDPVNPLSDEQQQAWDAFTAANPRANREQISGFFQAIGVDPATVNIEDMARAFEAGAEPRPGSESRFNIDISDARGQGGIGETADAAIRGVADIPTFGYADEISAGLDTITGDDSYAENLARQRAIDEYDVENNFAARMGGQLAGGVLLPSRVAASARGAARSALRGGEGRAGAQLAARTASRRQLTREGAAFGAGYGTGSAEGDIGDRLTGGALSGLAGGAGANALGRLGNVIASRGQSPNALARYADRVEAAEAAQAAGELGIEMLPADLGGPATRMATAVSRQTPGGVVPITRGARRVTQQSEEARDRIAARAGQVVEPEAAGQAATRGAQSSRRQTSQQGRRLYREVERMAEGVDVAPQNTMQTIARLIREEGQVPGGTDAMPVLEHYARAFEAGGPITIGGARGMRTALRQRLTAGNMTPGNADRITSEIMDAVGQDVTAALTTAGRQDAVAAYRQTDDFWRERLDTIHNVLEPIIGRRGERSGEQVVQALMQAGRGNSARLGRFIEALPAEEASTVRATLIQQLGRANPGAQNAEGTAFSLSTFLTHWNSLQPAARRAMFDDSTRAALTRLARVANRSRQSQAFSNFSNTGSVVSGVAQVGHFFAEPVSATFSLAGQYGIGALLANPRFARWLARMPENPRQIRSHVDKLSRIATTQPAIASDVSGLQQAILDEIDPQNDR